MSSSVLEEDEDDETYNVHDDVFQRLDRSCMSDLFLLFKISESVFCWKT